MGRKKNHPATVVRQCKQSEPLLTAKHWEKKPANLL